MRARYESFGGILALDRPAATVYVDRAYMRELGYADSRLWVSGQTYLSAPVTAHFAVTHRCPLGCRTWWQLRFSWSLPMRWEPWITTVLCASEGWR